MSSLDEAAAEGQWQILDRVAVTGGGELLLRRRGEVHEIRIDDRELMSSRVHGSEEALARYGCRHLAQAQAPCVLVGGLGLGYTLAAALRELPPTAMVVVAEQVEQVVRWNRTLLGDLAGHPLDDPRVELHLGDVGELLRATPRRFDAILLDVDNGPFSLSLKENRRLYGPGGLAAAQKALAPDGLLVSWSADHDPALQRLLRRMKLDFRSRPVGSSGGKRGTMHYLHIIAAT